MECCIALNCPIHGIPSHTKGRPSPICPDFKKSSKTWEREEREEERGRKEEGEGRERLREKEGSVFVRLEKEIESPLSPSLALPLPLSLSSSSTKQGTTPIFMRPKEGAQKPSPSPSLPPSLFSFLSFFLCPTLTSFGCINIDLEQNGMVPFHTVLPSNRQATGIGPDTSITCFELTHSYCYQYI